VTPLQLLAVLDERGVVVELRHGHAVCAELPADLRTAWIQHREAITAVLALRTAWVSSRADSDLILTLHGRTQRALRAFISLSGQSLPRADLVQWPGASGANAFK